jgi:UrcA family protein
MTQASFRAFAVAAALAATGPAFAAPVSVWSEDEQVYAKVTYADSELRSAKGAADVARRIRSAARRVCGGEDSVLLAMSRRFQTCQRDVIDRAVRRLDAPLVAEALGRGTNLAGR